MSAWSIVSLLACGWIGLQGEDLVWHCLWSGEGHWQSCNTWSFRKVTKDTISIVKLCMQLVADHSCFNFWASCYLVGATDGACTFVTNNLKQSFDLGQGIWRLHLFI